MNIENYIKNIFEIIKLKVSNYNNSLEDFKIVLEYVYNNIAKDVNLYQEIEPYDLELSVTNNPNKTKVNSITNKNYILKDKNTVVFDCDGKMYLDTDFSCIVKKSKCKKFITIKQYIIPIGDLKSIDLINIQKTLVAGCVVELTSHITQAGGYETTNFATQEYERELEKLKQTYNSHNTSIDNISNYF